MSENSQPVSTLNMGSDAQTPAVPTMAAPKPSSSISAIFGNVNFRLLWLGEGISLLGDQFHMIALPWLVLQLTGSALAVGTILAVAGIPRAIFMLVGGALTDRFTPRTLMLASNIARLVLTTMLALLVLTNSIQLWMLYVLSLMFGLADAFFFPAQSAMVPTLIEAEHLQTGNAIIQGTATLSLFVGPVLAGALIVAFSGARTINADVPPDMRGIGLAFALDALSFAVSALTLSLMRVQRRADVPTTHEAGLLGSIQEGLLTVWNNLLLRLVFLVVAALNLLINGPFAVGVPLLATRLPEGAAAFGEIMSAFGAGALIGIVLAGVLPKPAPESTMSRLMLVLTFMGIGLGLLGIVQTTLAAVLIALMMGTSNGYTNILAITWLQNKTPEALLGRVMGLLMFAAIGLNPVSTALAGVLAGNNPTALLVGAGILMTVFSLGTALNPRMRAIEAQHAA